MTEFEKLNNFLDKRKYHVVVFWGIVAILFISLYSPNLINRLTDDIPPPEGSTADEGYNLLSDYFPEIETDQSHVVLIHNEDGETVLSTETMMFTQALITFTQQTYNSTTKELTKIAGYYIFDRPEFALLKTQFISTDNSTTFITLYLNGDGDFQADAAAELREFVSDYEFLGGELYTTGMAELRMDLIENNEKDLKAIDSIVIPIVFIILILLLGNWRYFPITLAPIFISIGITFGVLERFIATTGTSLQSFIPSLLFSITLGVGIDYNLFLLTRFREERRKGKTPQEAVKTMLAFAGHTVFTSGLTLSIALVGVAFFPFVAVAGVGISISISVLVLLAVNLTLTPSLLLIFGGWVEKDRSETTDKEIKEEAETQKTEVKGWFYKVGKFATKYNYGVIVAILLFTLPLSFQMLQTTPESQMAFMSPIGSESGDGFIILNEEFGSGVLSPIQLIIIPESENVMTAEVFSDIQRFINLTIEQTIIEADSFYSHTYMSGSAIPFFAALNFINSSSPLYDTQEAMLYRMMGMQFVTSSEETANQAAILQIILPVDPSSPEARDLLDSIQDVADDVFGENYEVGYTGQTVIDDSSIEKTYDLFFLIIVLVIIAIYLLVGIMFKAVILPTRLIFSIGLTMSFIYGAATVVFQYDTFLNDIFPILDGVSVIFWIIPVMTFSIVLGLGMDYGIFTLERIKENIWNGMETNEAIADGIDKTGSIITGAGIIMMITFGGLMFSSSYVLIQFGFILAFSVFLDTFFVRTLLVPAILSMASKTNWWPSKPPTQE